MKKINDLTTLKNSYSVPDEAISFVLSMDESTPNGRYEFGEDCFVSVSSYDTKILDADMTMEAHEKYIDVQYIVSGEERILYTDKQKLEIAIPYNQTKDIAFYHFDVAGEVHAIAGEAVVLDTNEAHLPNVAITTPTPTKKAVIKLKK